MKRLYYFTALFLFSISVFAGGGWPQKKKKGYFKLSEFFIISDKYFTPSGDVIDIATSSIYITSIYGEYGITDRLTGIAYVPFLSRATLNEQVSGSTGNLIAPGDAVTSLGDFDLSLKYGLIVDKPIVVSATLTFGIPLGIDTGGDTGVLQTGDGEFNVMLTLEASRSFNQGKGYVNTLVAFNNRSNNFSDEFRVGAEVGHWLGGKRFLAALKVLSVNSLYNGSDFETPSNGIFSNNIEFLGVTPELNYFFNDKFGASAAVGFAPYGKRVLASPSYSVGLFMNL